MMVATTDCDGCRVVFSTSSFLLWLDDNRMLFLRVEGRDLCLERDKYKSAIKMEEIYESMSGLEPVGYNEKTRQFKHEFKLQ